MYSETLLIKAMSELFNMDVETLRHNAQIYLELSYAKSFGKLDWLPNVLSDPPIVSGEMLGQYLDCVTYHSQPYVFRVWYISEEEKDESDPPDSFWWSLTRHGATLDEGSDHFASTVEGCIQSAKAWFETNID